jgi:hypothetical protein
MCYQVGMKWDEFLAKVLPTAQPLTLAGSDYASKHGVEEPPDEPRFVSPTLREIVVAEPGSTSVVVISAPGAVGKTTLARATARMIGSPVWDLGRVKVGHDFLDGSVAKTFGDQAFASVMGELRTGKRALVLDGLDEARLGVGVDDSFIAFLDSLADRFQNAGARPSLVLLGRTQVVEESAFWLRGRGLSVGHYQIEYFDRAKAWEFVKKYLEHRPDDRRKVPESELRPGSGLANGLDELLERLQDIATEAGTEPLALAGYAPVLVVVSELLDDRNPYRVVQNLKKERGAWDSHALLGRIAGTLLDREHGKVCAQLGEIGTWEWNNRAYLPEEQRLRLLARRAGVKLQSPPPHDLPDALRDRYEEKVESVDHPFKDQAIFNDYLHAWGLVAENLDVGLREGVRAYFRSRERQYRPTPLLARFVAALRDSRELRVRAPDFGFVYESVLAGLEQGETARLTLASEDPGAPVRGEIVVLRGTESVPPQRLRLELDVSAGEALWFWRRLAYADITVAADVRIGSAGEDFALGPNADVECQAFFCAAPAVRVVAAKAEAAVSLVADSYQQGDETPRLVGSEQEHLRVSWPAPAYPWNRYQAKRQSSVRVTREVEDAYRRLRRIVCRFRGRGYDAIGRHQDIIDSPFVAGRGPSRALLRYCLDQRLVRSDPPFYVLDTEKLRQLGMHWQDFSAGATISQHVAQFLAGFSG